jgi:hypothetical protein
LRYTLAIFRSVSIAAILREHAGFVKRFLGVVVTARSTYSIVSWVWRVNSVVFLAMWAMEAVTCETETEVISTEDERIVLIIPKSTIKFKNFLEQKTKSKQIDQAKAVFHA